MIKTKKEKQEEWGLYIQWNKKETEKEHNENEVIIDPPALFYNNYSIFPH